MAETAQRQQLRRIAQLGRRLNIDTQEFVRDTCNKTTFELTTEEAYGIIVFLRRQLDEEVPNGA